MASRLTPIQTKQCLLEQLDEKDKQLNILQGMLDDTMLRVTHTQPAPQMGMMCMNTLMAMRKRP